VLTTSASTPGPSGARDDARDLDACGQGGAPVGCSWFHRLGLCTRKSRLRPVVRKMLPGCLSYEHKPRRRLLYARTRPAFDSHLAKKERTRGNRSLPFALSRSGRP